MAYYSSLIVISFKVFVYDLLYAYQSVVFIRGSILEKMVTGFLLLVLLLYALRGTFWLVVIANENNLLMVLVVAVG